MDSLSIKACVLIALACFALGVCCAVALVRVMDATVAKDPEDFRRWHPAALDFAYVLSFLGSLVFILSGIIFAVIAFAKSHVSHFQ